MLKHFLPLYCLLLLFYRIFDQYNGFIIMLNTITIKEIKIKIGSVCRNKRSQFGLSREELALALNMSSTTIQNIENGKNATLDNLLKVANHFGLLESIYKSIETLDDTSSNISLY